MSWRNAVAPKVEKLVRRKVGSQGPRKNLGSHIHASHSRQPLVKGERLVRYEVNAVMVSGVGPSWCQEGCAYTTVFHSSAGTRPASHNQVVYDLAL